MWHCKLLWTACLGWMLKSNDLKEGFVRYHSCCCFLKNLWDITDLWEKKSNVLKLPYASATKKKTNSFTKFIAARFTVNAIEGYANWLGEYSHTFIDPLPDGFATSLSHYFRRVCCLWIMQKNRRIKCPYRPSFKYRLRNNSRNSMIWDLDCKDRMRKHPPMSARHPKKRGTRQHSSRISSRSETNTASMIRLPPPTRHIPESGSACTDCAMSASMTTPSGTPQANTCVRKIKLSCKNV